MTTLEDDLRAALRIRAETLRVPERPSLDGDTAPVAHRPRGRWLLAAACVALVAAGVAALAVYQRRDTEPARPVATVPVETAPPTTVDIAPPSTTTDAVQASPFAGVWRSTDTAGSPQTMYIVRWDADVYHVGVSDTAGTVCAGVGRLASDTSLVVDRRTRSSNGAELACDGGTGSAPQSESGFTLDLSIAADQIVDSSGVVWRAQAAPPPDAEDVEVLTAFLDARVAGEGAEDYVGQGFSRDDRVPLLYATTSGTAYDRFEIERAQDPDGTAVYDVRLFADGGTVVQQRFMVSGVVVYGGPTLENGHAVLLPFSLLDGDVTFGMPSTWEVETFDDDHIAFRHRFGSSAFVVAAEPLSVWGSCDDGPAPATAEALARTIATGSVHDVIEPVPVQIAGIDGLQIDVAIADQQIGYLCTFEESGTLIGVQSGGERMRLFLVDRPGGTGVLTLAVMTTPDEFDEAITEIAPIVESVEFPLD